jgi:hypothetical protein
MVRGVITRVATVTAMIVAAVVALVGFSPAAAQAGPKVNGISISSKGMGDIKVLAKDKPDLFNLLLSEVSWLASATPQTAAPKSSQLGKGYTVNVLVKDKPYQVYQVFPLAAGGPRAHRSDKQPSGKVADGWFYGRLTMPESMRLAGVAIEPRDNVMNGGIGGGSINEVKAEEVNPVENVNAFLDQFRQLFLLNGAVLVVILFGLAGIAFLIRRRV